jgi:hypothetical protein
MLVREWTEEEELFLIQNYPKYGSKFCSTFLKRPTGGIRHRAKKLKLKWEGIKETYHKDFLEKIVKESNNIGVVLEKLNLRKAGGNYKVIHKYIKEYNLDISHFIKGEFKLGSSPKNKLDLDDILIENSTYNRTSLKKRLYDEGLLKRECCLCGQGEDWNGMKISLILDHINGVHNDNRIENLRIVCPNCNAGLDTFAGKNNKFEKKEKSVKKIKKKENTLKTDNKYINSCECGNLKLIESKSCEECFHTNRRKVERPSIEQLKKEVEEFGYSATGRKYGVSDNAVRKWIKNNIKESI